MASDNAGEGGALLKRIKITKAQRTMFIFVCGASMILGITAVLSIYFVKTIVFSNKLINQKQIVINSLKTSQDSLSGMSSRIDALTSSEYLESVATERSSSIDCSNYSSNSIFATYKTAEEVEQARLCSSLRVISDAMPSTAKATTSNPDPVDVDDLRSTTKIQIDMIMHEANLDNYEDDENGVTIDDAGVNSSSDSSLVSTSAYSKFNLNINATGDLDKLRSFLSTVDKSVRNFDLRNATIEFSDANKIQFTGDYYAYYTNPVNLQVLERTICADEDNAKCVNAGGDESIKESK